MFAGTIFCFAECNESFEHQQSSSEHGTVSLVSLKDDLAIKYGGIVGEELKLLPPRKQQAESSAKTPPLILVTDRGGHEKYVLARRHNIPCCSPADLFSLVLKQRSLDINRVNCLTGYEYSSTGLSKDSNTNLNASLVTQLGARYSGHLHASVDWLVVDMPTMTLEAAMAAQAEGSIKLSQKVQYALTRRIPILCKSLLETWLPLNSDCNSTLVFTFQAMVTATQWLLPSQQIQEGVAGETQRASVVNRLSGVGTNSVRAARADSMRIVDPSFFEPAWLPETVEVGTVYALGCTPSEALHLSQALHLIGVRQVPEFSPSTTSHIVVGSYLCAFLTSSDTRQAISKLATRSGTEAKVETEPDLITQLESCTNQQEYHWQLPASCIVRWTYFTEYCFKLFQTHPEVFRETESLRGAAGPAPTSAADAVVNSDDFHHTKQLPKPRRLHDMISLREIHSKVVSVKQQLARDRLAERGLLSSGTGTFTRTIPVERELGVPSTKEEMGVRGSITLMNTKSIAKGMVKRASHHRTTLRGRHQHPTSRLRPVSLGQANCVKADDAPQGTDKADLRTPRERAPVKLPLGQSAKSSNDRLRFAVLQAKRDIEPSIGADGTTLTVPSSAKFPQCFVGCLFLLDTAGMTTATVRLLKNTIRATGGVDRDLSGVPASEESFTHKIRVLPHADQKGYTVSVAEGESGGDATAVTSDWISGCLNARRLIPIDFWFTFSTPVVARPPRQHGAMYAPSEYSLADGKRYLQGKKHNVIGINVVLTAVAVSKSSGDFVPQDERLLPACGLSSVVEGLGGTVRGDFDVECVTHVVTSFFDNADVREARGGKRSSILVSAQHHAAQHALNVVSLEWLVVSLQCGYFVEEGPFLCAKAREVGNEVRVPVANQDVAERLDVTVISDSSPQLVCRPSVVNITDSTIDSVVLVDDTVAPNSIVVSQDISRISAISMANDIVEDADTLQVNWGSTLHPPDVAPSNLTQNTTIDESPQAQTRLRSLSQQQLNPRISSSSDCVLVGSATKTFLGTLDGRASLQSGVVPLVTASDHRQPEDGVALSSVGQGTSADDIGAPSSSQLAAVPTRFVVYLGTTLDSPEGDAGVPHAFYLTTTSALNADIVVAGSLKNFLESTLVAVASGKLLVMPSFVAAVSELYGRTFGNGTPYSSHVHQMVLDCAKAHLVTHSLAEGQLADVRPQERSAVNNLISGYYVWLSVLGQGGHLDLSGSRPFSGVQAVLWGVKNAESITVVISAGGGTVKTIPSAPAGGAGVLRTAEELVQALINLDGSGDVPMGSTLTVIVDKDVWSTQGGNGQGDQGGHGGTRGGHLHRLLEEHKPRTTGIIVVSTLWVLKRLQCLDGKDRPLYLRSALSSQQ